jgi:hypothetical protein
MRMNPEVFGDPDGDGKNKDRVRLVLSTGYQVEIDFEDPEQGVQHLAKAILGEIFLDAPKKNKAAEDQQNNSHPVAVVVMDEIKGLTNRLDGKLPCHYPETTTALNQKILVLLSLCSL